jgi:pyruvate,orthophosphate dikinase
LSADVFDLGHDHGVSPRELTDLLGGKAANLAEMITVLDLPVPPGFVVGTSVCREFLAGDWPRDVDELIDGQLRLLEVKTGLCLGDPDRPLLVSVRSGAPVSMPGMMSTVLNVGVTPSTLRALGARFGDQRFADEILARFTRTYGETVLGLDLGDVAMVPDDARAQLRKSIEAVFSSWRSDTAHAFRSREGISHDGGTAVVVQAMVFGNVGAGSGTGVAFTRNPATGENTPYGDYLPDAQGEDVVDGRHRTRPLAAMADHVPAAYRELLDVLHRLEWHYRDLCDVEFTVERGRLYVLQTRVGKRSAIAAVRMAVEMAQDPDFPLDRLEAVRRIEPEHLAQARANVRIDPQAVPLTRAVGASPGVAIGVVCTDPDRASALHARGADVILVREATAPGDVHGMLASRGLLTALGGLVSHAAVVARGWGIAAVVGATDLRLDEAGIAIGDVHIDEGEVITVDGTTGAVYLGDARHDDEHSTDLLPHVAIAERWAAELAIPFGSAPPEDRASDAGARTVSEFEVLRALQLRGVAGFETLATMLDTTTASVVGALENGDMVVETPRGIALNPTARAFVRDSLSAERATVDVAALPPLYSEFIALDAQFKSLVTQWQLQRADGAARLPDDLARELNGLHDSVQAICSEVGRLVPRLTPFARRFANAMAAVEAGDMAALASPLRDSYHTIWFELHEELIHLTGRTREAEESGDER